MSAEFCLKFAQTWLGVCSGIPAGLSKCTTALLIVLPVVGDPTPRTDRIDHDLDLLVLHLR